jgi:hypothetical protein
MLRRAISSVCCSAFALAFCMVGACYAQSSGTANTSGTTSTAQKSNAKPAKGTSTQPKMEISKKAVQALRLTDEARQAIINKDQHLAQKDVDSATNLLKQVEAKLPNNKNDKTHVVPIFAELEQTSFLQPVLTAKNQNQGQGQQSANSDKANSSANKTMANNSQSNALPQSDQPAQTPEVVNRVEGGYSYIALDVDAAMEHLQAAKQHLANNEPGKADLELARAQQSVDTGSVSTDMPLVRARENLALARDEVSSGKYSQAKAELKAAADALNNYAQDSHAQHAKDAKNLMTQIKSQAASMQGSHGIDKQKINAWWNEVANWTGQKTS